MWRLAAASVLIVTVVVGVAPPGWATLYFDCDHVTVSLHATVEVPPCNRSDGIDESPAECHQHRIDIGGDCDPTEPRGTAVVEVRIRPSEEMKGRIRRMVPVSRKATLWEVLVSVTVELI